MRNFRQKMSKKKLTKDGRGRGEGGSNSHLSHTFCRPLPIGNVLLTATATIEVPYYGRWLYRHSRFLGVQKVPMKSESSRASFLLKRTVDVTP